MADIWQLTVTYEDDDDGIYGPYTELQAKRLADKLMAEADEFQYEGTTYHPFNVRSAFAERMIRYDQVMSGADKRAARAAMKEGIAAEQQRIADSHLQ